MPNPRGQVAAEGIPEFNRRQILIASTALVAVTTVARADQFAKLIGIDDAPDVSQKFSGAGWYAFGRHDGTGMRVMYAEPDRRGFCPSFIDLSDGPSEKVQFGVSPHAFDYACWGKCEVAR